MVSKFLIALSFLGWTFLPANAQNQDSGFPSKLLIARHTFFDFGPPFNYYEVITVEAAPDGLNVERALVTPEGDACFQPPKVEVSAATVRTSMPELLKGKNPCNIPVKDLKKELKRCKKCLVFSGADVTMHVACGGNERSIRMDILDRDWFDKAANTPKQTSWTMGVMDSLDAALGPGVMDKPMFDTGNKSDSESGPPTEIVKKIQMGQFDDLFHSQKPLSEMAREASQRRPLPSVVVSGPFVMTPVNSNLPNYPPIAIAAHVEGVVSINFQVTPDGQTKNISFDGDKLLMLHGAVIKAVDNWKFPKSAEGHTEHVKIAFQLNCSSSAKSQ